MSYGQSISSMSLGRAWVHKFDHKLNMAQKYGYKGLELFYEDLEYLAAELAGDSAYENRIVAAHHLRHMCDERDIKIISMQPFYHYEGLLDRKLHEQRIDRLHEWFRVAKILGTDLILIPSNFLPADQLSGNFDDIVADLRKVADLGLQQTPVIRFCYESLAWGTHVSTWQQCYKTVLAVDRANMGICLDAFNIAALVYADPTKPNGRTSDCDTALQTSLSELVETIDVSKLFIVQLADAEQLDEPLVEGHRYFDAIQPARMSWSRNCRLFYGEEGSYLPTRQIMQTIIHKLGYQGWISAELFNRRMSDADPDVPEELARRGRASWLTFQRDMGLIPTTPSDPMTSTLVSVPALWKKSFVLVEHLLVPGTSVTHHTYQSLQSAFSKGLILVKAMPPLISRR